MSRVELEQLRALKSQRSELEELRALKAQREVPAEEPTMDSGKIDFEAEIQKSEEEAAARREVAATVVTGAIAEPIAGAAGIGALIRGASPELAQQEIEMVRQDLTFQPRTQEGQEALQAVGKAFAPVGGKLQEVRKSTGDLAMRLTGSPIVAAIATALPDATIEALGFGIGRKFAAAKTGLKKTPSKIPQPGKIKERAVTKSLLESAPEVQQIKDASRAIYKEIDDLNVVVKPDATSSLIRKVVGRAKKENVDAVLTPKSARVVENLSDELRGALPPKPRSLTEIDQIRKQAQIAAQALDPSDARVGAIMVDEIDAFLDKIPHSAFTGPDAKAGAKISARYKTARNLWGRMRRAELIQESFEKAQRSASGFENGLRKNFRQILDNKKRSRFFTKDELKAMDDVVQGTGTTNTLKLLGRLGFSEGGATNILGGLGGIAVLGPVAAPIGQVARELAQKSTVRASNRVVALIRGGAKGRKITKAYLQAIPKGKRSARELSDLLLASGSDVDDLLKSADKIAREAAEITRARKVFERAQAAGAAAPAAVAITQQEQ